MLEIAGIAVEVHKKDIKHLHLYVKPPSGKVSVSAPLAVGDEVIERFVRTRLPWVKKQMEQFDGQPRQAPREYVSGETLYVWGKQYYLRLEQGRNYSLALRGNKAIFTARPGSTAAQRQRFVREWYRGLLKDKVPRLLPQWEQRTGLRAAGWQTKYMTTRWGTCNSKTGKIWLNLQLAKKPPQCLSYVILHELVHLAEKTHGEPFVALMDQHMPLWREVRATLNGQKLDSWKE